MCRLPSLAFYVALMGLREMGTDTNQQEALATTFVVINKSALSLSKRLMYPIAYHEIVTG